MVEERGAPHISMVHVFLNDVLGVSFCIHILHRRMWECNLMCV